MDAKPVSGLRSRLVWFVVLWVAGVLAVSTVAYAIKLVIGT